MQRAPVRAPPVPSQVGDPPADVEGNAEAEALMQRALAAHERKRQETDAAKKQADKATPALKKGFLSAGKPKNGKAKTPAKSDAQPQEEVPYITGCGSAADARKESLKLPEVQEALRQTKQKLGDDNSWVTPQLIQAMGSRPDLMKAMSDPKVKEAMALMSSDPEAAKLKYANDPVVLKFMKEFSSLMAVHFQELGKHESKEKPQTPTKPASNTVVPMRGAKLPPGSPAPLPIDNPVVAEALMDPEVQTLINQMRQGRSPEMHEICQRNPRLFQKLKILLDNGLLNLQS